jgi:predicted aldo/keto reductase-like oxidoreductase
MIYKNFKDKKLSALGMGCMRLPLAGDTREIDVPAVREMVAYAIGHGLNYFDTAWGYHGGKSESVMGEVLSEYDRSSYYLASKFPGYDLNCFGKQAEIFEKQLEKCRVDHFDFYLFHNVCEMNIERYLDPQYGVADYLLEQKKNGRINHLGFSCHGQIPVLRSFLERYGDIVEFCQLQVNWLDYGFQNAREKMAICGEYGIPVWVMEPVRGGSLIKLEEEYESRLRELRPDESNAGWAFRFLQTIPDVTVTLSGMSNLEQMKENVSLFEEEKPLSRDEMLALMSVAARMSGRNTVPCTACRYCTEYCPTELDIPHLIALYNEFTFTGGGFIAPMAIAALDEDKKPSACLGCRSCEAVCPQGIKISEIMAAFAEAVK